jgi:uncharacterized protein
MDLLAECVGFDWDEGNLLKNWEKHGVSAFECEQVFFNQPLIAAPDEAHSSAEPRFYALGQTDASRKYLGSPIKGVVKRKNTSPPE